MARNKECVCCGRTLYDYDEYAEINGEVNCKECVTCWTVQDFLEILKVQFKQALEDKN